ncbi:EamA family transporter [Pseudomonas sp. NPDC007930]|uniref:DMT family transporter n=1 Tax=Pseudomonas sp. NPDC007930 TaxID=3364417 RepID=UPI0036E1B037
MTKSTAIPSAATHLPLPLLEAALVLCWSSGFIGARFSIGHAPAFLVVFWRCLVVALVLTPWVLAEVRRAPARVLLRHAALGLLAMAGYLAGVVGGIALGVPSGLAALIADLLPMGTALLGVLLFGQRLAPRVWLGMLLGALGVGLMTAGALRLGDAPLWAYALPLLGMLSLAVATLWQPGEGGLGVLANLWVQSLASAGAFALLAWAQGGLAPRLEQGFVLSVLWTAGLANLGGYGLYWLCLRRASAARVASVLYLSPAVTLLAGAWLFGEPLGGGMLLGMVVAAAGIALVLRAPR